MTPSKVNGIALLHVAPVCADNSIGSNRYAGNMNLAYFMDKDLQKITQCQEQIKPKKSINSKVEGLFVGNFSRISMSGQTKKRRLLSALCTGSISCSIVFG